MKQDFTSQLTVEEFEEFLAMRILHVNPHEEEPLDPPAIVNNTQVVVAA